MAFFIGLLAPSSSELRLSCIHLSKTPLPVHYDSKANLHSNPYRFYHYAIILLPYPSSIVRSYPSVQMAGASGTDRNHDNLYHQWFSGRSIITYQKPFMWRGTDDRLYRAFVTDLLFLSRRKQLGPVSGSPFVDLICSKLSIGNKGLFIQIILCYTKPYDRSRCARSIVFAYVGMKGSRR